MTGSLDWWLERDKSGAGQAAAEASWNSWLAPHRYNIDLALRLVYPFRSLYEIGCQAGPNLRMVHTTYPEVELFGCEPCETARRVTRDRLPCKIESGVLPFVPGYGGRLFDVVLSCYTLAYVSDTDIQYTLKLLSEACSTIILLEPTSWGAVYPTGMCRNDLLKEWRHPYHEIIRGIGWHVAWAWLLPEPVQNANACMVCVK